MMGEGTTNYESAQLAQDLDLKEGVACRVRCRMRWDSFSGAAGAPIVNYGLYHEASNTWYGPIDQVLRKTADWETCAFTHVPP